MSFAYTDQTIRVRKLPTGPTRNLRQQFAVERPRRWPYVVIVALAAFALATPVRMPERAPTGAERTTEAQQLLRLLGR
ncbi:MAG TPA: hypothetical protein VFV99_07395 [Kofleriaceae bacterium]|nr:hypothetical protein [Kofleriaceae bacterium]